MSRWCCDDVYHYAVECDDYPLITLVGLMPETMLHRSACIEVETEQIVSHYGIACSESEEVVFEPHVK